MLSITLNIDKSANRVVFAEGDIKFADILLSFLTLPLGSVCKFGSTTIHCLDNLYKSVVDLARDNYLKVHKERLLKLSHAAELECVDLAVNLDAGRALTYYACSSYNSACRESNVLSPYRFDKCTNCGCTMSANVTVGRKPGNKGKNEGVFLKGLTRFMITDDFVIMPVSTQAVLKLLGGHGGHQKNNLEKRCVTVGLTEVHTLLRMSMISENAFTDAFLTRGTAEDLSLRKTQASLVLKSLTNSSSSLSNDQNHVSIKLIVDKHANRVLYAECDQDFVDLLFNFLTYPSGYVVKNLNVNCHITCFDNLYASAVSPALAGHFKTDQAKEYVVNPKLSPSFIVSKLNGSLIKSQTMSMPDSNEPNITDKRMKLIDWMDENGFVFEATYIVTDDLVVTPSISSVMHLIANAKEGVEVVSVNVGNKEVFWLLEAALGSKTALTDVFMN